MKFRTKLFYSFCLLGLISILLVLCTLYVETFRLISGEMRDKVGAILVYTQKKIDRTFLQNVIDDAGKSESAQFKAMRQDFLEIIELNRRSDIYVKGLYLIKKCKDSDLYYYVMDVRPGDLEKEHSFGELHPFPLLFPPQISSPHLGFSSHFKEKEEDLRGYAPIFGETGAERAFIGIDVRKKELCVDLQKFFFYGWTTFGASIVIGICLSSFLSKRISESLRKFCTIVRKIGKGNFSVRSTFDARDEFQELFISIQAMAKGLEERERLKSNFARYVSKHALEEVLRKEGPFSLGQEGKRKRVTLLFSDIRHFTALAEELPPEEVLKILNEYFTEMLSVIFKYRGTLDKFIGDGLMVEFGAPFKDPLQEFHAVLAAIHMQLRLNGLSDRWEKEGRKRLSMGIGIHTGFAVLGNIGSELRMEYTAIGDTVNVASRLERLTRKIERPIILSKSVYDKVKDFFIFEDLKEIKIPGRKGTIQVYSIDPHVQKNLDALDLIHNKD